MNEFANLLKLIKLQYTFKLFEILETAAMIGELYLFILIANINQYSLHHYNESQDVAEAK